MTRYEIIDHTTDIGLKAYGRTLEELFSNLALGMLGIICDVTAVQPMASIPILVQADGLELLAAAWLREILRAADRDRMVFMNCKVYQVTPQAVTGEVTGEAFDLARHGDGRRIKSVGHRDLAVQQEGGMWTAQVTFDI